VSDPTRESDCCRAPARVSGEGRTHWYECTECGDSCDTVTVDRCGDRPRWTKDDIALAKKRAKEVWGDFFGGKGAWIDYEVTRDHLIRTKQLPAPKHFPGQGVDWHEEWSKAYGRLFELEKKEDLTRLEEGELERVRLRIRLVEEVYDPIPF